MSKKNELLELQHTLQTLLGVIVDYNVVQVSEKRLKTLAKEYDLEPVCDLYGFTDYKKKTVYIRRDMTNVDKLQTYLHEFAHVYDENFEVSTGNKDMSEERIDKLGAKWKKLIFGV